MDEFERRLEREKLAALKELAYGASHEINNPLANIATRAQILLKDEAHPERRRMLSAIHAQAMRAHEMIADLMLFASPPALVLAEVDLNGLVEQVVASWRDRAQEQSTELAFSASADPTVAAADATQVAVAVDAVVRNALEAVAAGGRVRVTVRRSELEGSGSVEILVADSGPGMSVETRRHAFDPFFSGREAGRGLGFGLSKCWRIIDEHGGEVLLASAPGAGTEVTLRLPIRRRDS
jgi:signal transduction histidine kinase